MHIQASNPSAFPSGGGKMGQALRTHDWNATPLGSPESWPQGLRAALTIALNSACPAAIFWGPDFATFCNDACLVLLAGELPPLGQPAREVWPDLWRQLEPHLREGLAGTQRLAPIAFHRPGQPADQADSVSFAPLARESGAIGGLLALLMPPDQESESLSHMANEQLRVVLGRITDAYYQLDREWCFRDINRQALEYFGCRCEDVLGRSFWELFPVTRGSFFDEQIHLAVESRTPMHFEFKSLIAADHWAEIHIYPTEDGVEIYFRDISERKRVEEQLRQQAEQLSETDRRKDEFLAVLAHELRNPLAPISSAVELLRAQAGAPAGGPECKVLRGADIIDRQVRQLTRLVDDLLDIARIARNKIDLKNELVELTEALTRAIETARPLIDARRHQLSLSLPVESLRLNGDLARLAQIVSNLLTNAAKYTEEGGQIWLSAERQSEEAVIRVRDTGIGIRPEMLPHVFDLYSQAGRSEHQTQGGLGIGLNLVYRLVQMHGGRVSAASAGPGKGSEFTVWLPVLAQPAQAAAQGATPVHPAAPAAEASETGRKVLVVDDNVDSANSLGELIELWGHQVRVAHDGPAALELAMAEPPDVVLLDIGLPGMNGYQVARLLRAQPNLGQALLVALTGYGQEEDRRQAAQSGFDRYFTKPVDLESLDNLLKRKQAPERRPQPGAGGH